jgi:hypothetical protein
MILLQENNSLYSESIKRDVKTRPLKECRCQERPLRLKKNYEVEESTLLVLFIMNQENESSRQDLYMSVDLFYFESRKRELKTRLTYECCLLEIEKARAKVSVR